MEAIYKLLGVGKIQPIYSTMPLAEAAKAHDMLEIGQILGKMLLTP